jgi:hypothetical protein
MSERLPEPEKPRLTEAQEATLRDLCERYRVEYDPDHYHVNPPDSVIAPGYAEGWLGGGHHANPQYMKPYEPAGHPTIYVGVDPEGRANS